jgi:TetR/AcrR family transcriptional regulator, cholesterol catabolism regulator
MELKTRNIADRARGVFMKYGIRSVSMDDICRELGMSKKTLYQNFGNKSDLVNKILQQSFEDFEAHISAIRGKAQNAIDDLLEISLIIDGHMNEASLAISFDLQKFYPEIHSEYLQKRRSFVSGYLRENFEKGIKEGYYRPDLNIDLIARLYMQKIEDLHDPNFYKSDEISFDEVFHVMFENHIRGIANEKGISYFEERKKTLKLKW